MKLSSLAGAAAGAAGGLGGMGGGLSYSALQSKYQDFAFPQAEINLGGKVFSDKDGAMVVDDIRLELTSGFEASIATFKIYNVYDTKSGKFKFEDVKSQVLLGVPMEISLGYLGTLLPVFVGFVAGVNFGFDPLDLPYIEVTGMDVKGIMMSNNYAYQLTANNYGDAVSEILKRTAYDKLKTAGGITGIEVTQTPDKPPPGAQQTATAYTVEMASESDYEFIVKAAKRFNYEFFVDRGKVYFRKAKSDASTLATLGVGSGIESFNIGYSVTGIVQNIEARAMDPGTGKVISSKGKFANDMSTSSKAKSLVSKSQLVYIDPTISSQKDADARVASLMEQMSYRLASLDCECVGIPDLVPGRFVAVSGLGSPVDNNFYITNVIHSFHSDMGFKTKLVGKADKVKKSAL